MAGNSARVLPVLVLLLAGRTSAQAQRPPAFDPERIFILGDNTVQRTIITCGISNSGSPLPPG